MLTVACCLVVELGLGLELYLVSGWLVEMHTCLYYFPLSLSLSQLQYQLKYFLGRSRELT